MNHNVIRIDGWSNPDTAAIYESQWRESPELKRRYENGDQCGGCAFFAAFNSDWGLCCHKESRHHLETVFEHFTCQDYVRECWGPHSFTKDADFHCRCGGEPSEYWDNLISILQQYEARPPETDRDDQPQ